MAPCDATEVKLTVFCMELRKREEAPTSSGRYLSLQHRCRCPPIPLLQLNKNTQHKTSPSYGIFGKLSLRVGISDLKSVDGTIGNIMQITLQKEKNYNHFQINPTIEFVWHNNNLRYKQLILKFGLHSSFKIKQFIYNPFTVPSKK